MLSAFSRQLVIIHWTYIVAPKVKTKSAKIARRSSALIPQFLRFSFWAGGVIPSGLFKNLIEASTDIFYLPLVARWD
jgi:hypothetical protein